MSESKNVEIVKQLYAAFDQDDPSAVLRVCAPDAEWQYPAAERIRYGGRWRGQEEIARFLATHDEQEEILDFRPDEIVAQGDRVAVLGGFRGRAKPTGEEWATDFVHAMAVRDGKIRRFEAYFDTAAAVAAHHQ